MLKIVQLKMNGAGDGQGGGGAAGSNAGGAGTGANNSGTGAGGGLLTGGGSGNSGAASGGNDNKGGGNENQVVFPENWKLGLPKELQESTALSAINDIPSLAKSYLHAQKMVGVDKIPLPSKHATPEEWREVYKKLGLPADVKDYSVKLKDGHSLDGEFINKFAAKAHEVGVLPHQAQALAEHFEQLNNDAVKSFSEAHKAKLETGLKELKAEWGDAFNDKIQAAQNAVAHFGGEPIKKYLEQSGLTDDVQLVRLFAKVAEVLKEDGLPQGNTASSGAMTPAAAQEAANRIIADFSHPYHIADHPNHKAAVEEVSKYFAMARKK